MGGKKLQKKLHRRAEVDNEWLKIWKIFVFKLLPFPLPTKFNALLKMAVYIYVGYKYFFPVHKDNGLK